jgi:hypothetical protein
MHCAPLKTLVVCAFLGDLQNKADIVSRYNSLSPCVQSLWTADSHASYVRDHEPWLFTACPGLSNHSYSTYHECLVHVNDTYRARYLNFGPWSSC